MLKEIVYKLLKEQDRPLGWLATEMDMTPDGLKLSLTNESMKYTNLKLMATVLNVAPEYFFSGVTAEIAAANIVNDELAAFQHLKQELAASKELVETLKSQLRDKDRIIDLLGKANN
ncbi:hypothetical protein [Hufsiella ginkgonis]|uniref:XRE family transcriptional regulator n=1 Tax=Hufsiella ginkgonis TaxID=2695274 RepID=A0A7K1XV96_9SPHI|nr:hypothetical protein [Hufsiella ginkgonis]MXV14902.1 hypothetical protein [Hufsiella ginkgonis]